MRNDYSPVRKTSRGRNLNNLILINSNTLNANATSYYKKISLPSLFLSNTRSLVNKIEDLEVVINQNDMDIACITETWLTNNIPNSVVDISGYSLVRIDRSADKRGGGVCTYIKSSIDFTTIDELNDSPFESLWVYLRPNRLPRGFSFIIIGIIYHPPQDDDTIFTEHLIASLDAALNKYPNAGIILAGDFNRLNYRHISNHFDLRQTVKNPTRCAAILNLIFTNLFHHYKTPQILPGISLSDHNSLLICPLMRTHKTKVEIIFRRNVKPSMKSCFGRWLTSTDWSFLESLPNCKEKLVAFQSSKLSIETLNFAIETFFPLQKMKQHPTDRPWVIPDLKSLIQQRQQALFKILLFTKN